MISKKYKIANTNLLINLFDFMLKTNDDAFSLLRSDNKNSITYNVYRGLPGIPSNESTYLIYQDKQNIVYKRKDLLYRYIGEFTNGNILKESRCCIIYSQAQCKNCTLFINSKLEEIKESRLFNCLGLEQFLGYAQHAIIHSSFITYRDVGIIFSAPSGTGKSTQANLWQKYVDDVEIINGDRSVLSCQEEKVIVSGIPFCGSSNISLNKSAPLQAVVVLRQGKSNVLEKLSPMEAFHYLYSECSIPLWDDEAVQGIVQVLSKVVIKVPIYLYHCVKDESAVCKLLEMIEGDM